MKKGKYLTCPTCNKVFYRESWKINKNNYCSRKCGYKQRKGKYLTCSVCNKVFYRKPSEIRDFNYCSQKCHYSHRLKLIKTLEKATKQYPKTWQELIRKWYVIDKISVREITKQLKLANRVIPKALRYLNIPQRPVYERIALQWVNNEQRKKEHGERMSKLLKGKPAWNKGQTKETHPSTLRQAKWMTGVNNPMYGKRGKAHHSYKNGKYTAEKKRFWSTSEYCQWRKAVYERDNYACQKCGDNKGGNLNAHHIKSFVNHPKLRYDVSNGITLCDKCHRFTHQSVTLPTLQRQFECRGGPSISS